MVARRIAALESAEDVEAMVEELGMFGHDGRAEADASGTSPFAAAAMRMPRNVQKD